MKKQARKQASGIDSNRIHQPTRRSEIDDQTSIVSDPAAVYHARAVLSSSVMPESQMNAFQKIEMIRKGVTKNSLETLKQRTGLDYDRLASILSVARATLINKKGAEKFSLTVSEKIISLADVYSYGYEIFEDKTRFNAWVFQPNQALGGQVPYNLMDNQYGREEVKNLIGRIAHGIYS